MHTFLHITSLQTKVRVSLSLSLSLINDNVRERLSIRKTKRYLKLPR